MSDIPKNKIDRILKKIRGFRFAPQSAKEKERCANPYKNKLQEIQRVKALLKEKMKHGK